MKTPRYKNKPIGSIETLAWTLNISKDVLIETANKAKDYYSPNDLIIKPNGKTRQTFTVLEPLHTIQDNILEKLISKVEFPEYLQGSIKDDSSPRDYINDARLHSGREVLLKEDISSFFSSTKTRFVHKIWKCFFKFPEEVAFILTSLTTYDDLIPEGASTSPAIANLVFWRREPELEFSLRQKGYLYTRYVDDITVSFVTRVNKREIQEVTTKIYGMFNAYGLRPNRDKDEKGFLKKRTVRSKNKPMVVHGLNINSGKPSIPKKERLKIRAAVRELENWLNNKSRSIEEMKEGFDSVTGRVNILKRLHPKEAKQYIVRMKTIKKELDSLNN